MGYKVEGIPAGFVHSFNYDDLVEGKNRKFGECSMIAVNPIYRRKGLGTHLILDSMEDRARYDIDALTIWPGLKMEPIVKGILASTDFETVKGDRAREVLVQLPYQSHRDRMLKEVDRLRGLVNKKYASRPNLK